METAQTPMIQTALCESGLMLDDVIAGRVSMVDRQCQISPLREHSTKYSEHVGL